MPERRLSATRCAVATCTDPGICEVVWTDSHIYLICETHTVTPGVLLYVVTLNGRLAPRRWSHDVNVA